MGETISTLGLVGLTGATYRQLNRWVDVGLLEPINPRPGRGTPRAFLPAEVRVADCLTLLAAEGRPGGEPARRALSARLAAAARAEPAAWAYAITADAVTPIAAPDDLADARPQLGEAFAVLIPHHDRRPAPGYDPAPWLT